MFPTKLAVMSICALLILYITGSNFEWEMIFFLSGMFTAHISKVKLTQHEEWQGTISAISMGMILTAMFGIAVNLAVHENLLPLAVLYAAGIFVAKIRDLREFLRNASGKKKD